MLFSSLQGHDFVDAQVLVQVLLPLRDRIDIVPILDVVKAADGLELLLIEIVLVQDQLLFVVLMVDDDLLEHVDHSLALVLYLILVLDEYPEICPLN